ncbi:MULTISPECIES: aldo/keto reductase [Carboxydothermus]|uniref:Oxidoreductase, aldo/keto reductase family n=2 Tax=Carboxydothermus TaxID=129957 RepID=Q3AEN5_CARHZ|nr:MULTISPECIES: aldo/keto reductase [Carboxydothermus]ABB13778.1 oxidoreductase, aldo/keto reductase family [Carboxydothermus hydrogenoformans Z-2901]NYE56422.1 putative aldo/keto reductase-like oxidoreductase [Carboxydothermus ferrireducens DSM 11255]
MERRVLGRTGIEVSRLCFGALTIGPLQRNLPLKEGARLIRLAIENGVNFIDTAELYQTYPYIRRALKGLPPDQVVIATKSYAATAQAMEKSLKEALTSLGRDYIDIFLLHEQESYFTLKGHEEALFYLQKAKEKGYVRAVGISTHFIAGVRAGMMHPAVEVIHPLINYRGIGIADGTAEEMLAAISEAYLMGKGLYGMKPLGGGHLGSDFKKAFDFVLGIKELSAIAVGMKSEIEVIANINYFQKSEIDGKIEESLKKTARKLHIESWCQGCGRCVKVCSQKALTLGPKGKVRVNQEKCLFCGYCGAHCPHFAIKVI